MCIWLHTPVHLSTDLHDKDTFSEIYCYQFLYEWIPSPNKEIFNVHCLVKLTCRNQWQWGSALDNLSCFSSILKNKQVLQMNSTMHKVTILKYVPHENVHKTAQAQTRTTGHVHYNLIKYTCECHMLYGTIMNSNWPIIVCATHWTFHKSK